jgi:hypothetical protein
MAAADSERDARAAAKQQLRTSEIAHRRTEEERASNAHGESRGALSSASDDGGGIPNVMREQLGKVATDR